MVPHGLRGSQVRAPPPRCVAGAAPNGSPRRPASVPTRFFDWLRRAGRWGRDQKGLGAPLRESSCLATGRWPSGYPAQRAREGARPQPTRPGLRRGSSPGPQALPGAPGSRIGPGSRKTWSQLWGVLEQASTLLPDRRRGRAPHPHPVFVQGAGGHYVRSGNGGPGNPLPPTPRPGPLGNSKNTSGVSGESPVFSLPERPGDGLSEVRPQI